MFRTFLAQVTVLTPYSEIGVIVATEFYGVFAIQISLLLILINFRVFISKEIEISKSGTSSTSSGGSSKSSSSSNSSDPVIEL